MLGILKGIPVKRLTPKSYLKSFTVASESHKTLTRPFELTSGSFLIGRRRILVIPRNHLEALRSCLRLTYEYEFHTLPNTKVSTAKDHGESYMKIRPPLVRQVLGNRLFLSNGRYSETQSWLNFEILFIFLLLSRVQLNNYFPFSRNLKRISDKDKS